MIDLRSDTFTKPTDEMRKAMYMAEVGDDVYGEDPTANKLQEMAAEITGKEESLIVSSGCMGNLIPMMIKGGRGKEVICAPESHIMRHEIGAISSIASTFPVTVASDHGIISAAEVEKKLHGYAYDASDAAIIETENTTSGLVYPLDTLQEIKALSEKHGLWVHLDGARIFNASVATGRSVKEYAATADDITFCLSKGLGAPALSVLSSTHDFIKEAKRCRKILGGGMRQIGILAAAGIYALENHVERLQEDHANREMIGTALEESGWADVEISATNMIFFKSKYPIQAIIEAFKRKGVLFLEDGGMGRMVTSISLTTEDAKEAVRLIKETKPSEFLV